MGAGTGVVIEGAGEPDLPIAFTPTKVTMLASPASTERAWLDAMSYVINEEQLSYPFCRQANAEHLSAELPWEGEGRVLYPASAKAGPGLQVTMTTHCHVHCFQQAAMYLANRVQSGGCYLPASLGCGRKG